jgi:hypothetical protein
MALSDDMRIKQRVQRPDSAMMRTGNVVFNKGCNKKDREAWLKVKEYIRGLEEDLALAVHCLSSLSNGQCLSQLKRRARHTYCAIIEKGNTDG